MWKLVKFTEFILKIRFLIWTSLKPIIEKKAYFAMLLKNEQFFIVTIELDGNKRSIISIIKDELVWIMENLLNCESESESPKPLIFNNGLVVLTLNIEIDWIFT